jgi:tetratricopeptide (TPR) repeat protein
VARRWLAPLFVSTWLLPGLAAAEAPVAPEPPASAEERAVSLHDEAREHYERGHYRAAAELLEQALVLDPDGVELLYNLGLIYERLGELEVAEGYYRRYVEREPDAARRARGEAILRRIRGAAQSKAPTAPAPEPTGAAAPSSYLWLVPGGIAVAAAVTGTVFGIGALARDPGETPRTAPGTAVDDLRSDAETAHTFAVVADVAFLVSAVAVGATVALYATSRGETEVALAVAPGSGAVRVRF